MTKTLEERITYVREISHVYQEYHKETAAAIGLNYAVGLIKELQAENQALQKKLDEALERMEIAKTVLEKYADDRNWSEFYENGATGLCFYGDIENYSEEGSILAKKALAKLNEVENENH